MPYLSRKEIIGLIKSDKKIVESVKEKYLLRITCPLCKKDFYLENKNNIYCNKCSKLSYDIKVKDEKKNYRKEYKKMYARKSRGKITEADFLKWKEKKNQIGGEV